MKSIKIDDLIGVALDWAVAVAVKRHARALLERDLPTDFPPSVIPADDVVPVIVPFRNSRGFALYENQNAKREGIRWQPSMDYSQGGPLLFQFKISTCYNPDMIYEDSARWKALGAYSTSEDHVYGPDLLAAGMRCIVRDELGDEVDVPDELLPARLREPSNRGEIIADFTRLALTAPKWTLAQRREAVIDTLSCKWDMFKDEVAEIVDASLCRKILDHQCTEVLLSFDELPHYSKPRNDIGGLYMVIHSANGTASDKAILDFVRDWVSAAGYNPDGKARIGLPTREGIVSYNYHLWFHDRVHSITGNAL